MCISGIRWISFQFNSWPLVISLKRFLRLSKSLARSSCNGNTLPKPAEINKNSEKCHMIFTSSTGAHTSYRIYMDDNRNNADAVAFHWHMWQCSFVCSPLLHKICRRSWWSFFISFVSIRFISSCYLIRGPCYWHDDWHKITRIFFSLSHSR